MICIAASPRAMSRCSWPAKISKAIPHSPAVVTAAVRTDAGSRILCVCTYAFSKAPSSPLFPGISTRDAARRSEIKKHVSRDGTLAYGNHERFCVALLTIRSRRFIHTGIQSAVVIAGLVTLPLPLLEFEARHAPRTLQVLLELIGQLVHFRVWTRTQFR